MKVPSFLLTALPTSTKENKEDDRTTTWIFKKQTIT